MIYDRLAVVYDDLFKDDKATKRWVKFVKDRLKSESKILELACGSGEMAIALANEGYSILASDSSTMMLKQLENKQKNRIETMNLDMCNFNLEKRFDGVCCFCDSVNYCASMDDFRSMCQCAYHHLNNGGYFLFDMHTPYRLEEFKEMYIEEGKCTNCQYQWTLIAQDSSIHHHFSFWFDDGSFHQEMHEQKIFSYLEVKDCMNEIGFDVEVFTDFDKLGIHDGEKYFIVGRKKT